MGTWIEVSCPACGHFHALSGADRIDPDKGLQTFGRKMRSDGRGTLEVVEAYTHPSENIELAAAWRNRVAERVLMIVSWLIRDSFLDEEEFLALLQRAYRKFNVWWNKRGMHSMESDSIRAKISPETKRRSIDE